MRMIDADALMKLARNNINRTVDCNDIARFPTVEAEPIRHGRWISVGLASLKCSKCKYVDDYKMYYKRCPECGAWMYGGES
jgi:hypothetical protein